MSCFDLAAPPPSILLQGALWHAGPVVAHLFGQDALIAAQVACFCKGLVPGLLPQV